MYMNGNCHIGNCPFDNLSIYFERQYLEWKKTDLWKMNLVKIFYSNK